MDFAGETYFIARIIELLEQVDSRISKEQMLTEWFKITDIIDKFNKYNYEEFVISVHEWLRVYKNQKYNSGSWNFFVALTSDTGCNCLCSSIFIILCCIHVGLFPNKVVGAVTQSHMFVTNYNQEYIFEGTYVCKSEWININLMRNLFEIRDEENFLILDSYDAILNIIVVAAVKYIGDSQTKINLLTKFPNNNNPISLYELIINSPRIPIYKIENLINVISINNFEAVFAGTLYNIIRGIGHSKNPNIVMVTHKAFDLLLYALSNNPNNDGLFEMVQNSRKILEL